MIFKRKLKITQISSSLENSLLFTVGLGNDGRVYLWNSERCGWILHKQLTADEVAENQRKQADRERELNATA